MRASTHLACSLVLICAGAWRVPTYCRQLQETLPAATITTDSVQHDRHLQQLGETTVPPDNTAVPATPVVLPSVAPGADVPAVQLPAPASDPNISLAVRPAAATAAIPAAANSTALTVSSSRNSSSSLGPLSPASVPAVAGVATPAAGGLPATLPNSTAATSAATTAVVATPTAAALAPTGFPPPAAAGQSVQQQILQQFTPTTAAASAPNAIAAAAPIAAAAAAPNATAVEAPVSTAAAAHNATAVAAPVETAAATPVTAKAAAPNATAAPAAASIGSLGASSVVEQWAWSAGTQPDAGVSAQQQPVADVQEKAVVTTVAVTAPAPSTSPEQAAWSAGWEAHPDVNDLLISSDNDHQAQSPAPQQGSVQITILHFNDWHVRVEATKESYCALCTPWDVDQGRCSGGLARMSTFIKQQRQIDPELLLLNAGDDFIGTEWDRKAGMDAPAAFMNLLAPDAMTIGNHEWDKGLYKLKEYLDLLNTTKEAVLGANIDFGGHELRDKVQRYVVKEVKGKKVCIFGLTTQYALPGNDRMWPVYIKEPYSVGREVLKDLEQEGCHATILLSHLGYTSDLVAAKVLPGLDLVVGGHSHSFLWPDQYNPPAYYMDGSDCKKDETWGPYPTYVHSNNRDIPVVQASWASRYMGRLILTFDSENQGGKCNDVKGQVFMLGGPDSQYHVEQDQEALDKIKQYHTW